MSSETLKRINLDKVKELFAERDITPEQLYSDSCIMRVVLNDLPCKRTCLDQGFDISYVFGVICGWDDFKHDCWFHDISTYSLEYKLGVADGAAAWKIMIGE